jgi:hypothetical protein
MNNTSTSDAGKALCCSFCDKSQHDVYKLFAGLRANFCNECVDLCTDILRLEAHVTEANKKILDDYLIGRQHESKDEHLHSLTTEEVDKLIRLLGLVFGVRSLSAVVDQEQSSSVKVFFAGLPIGFISRSIEDGNSPYIFSMSIRKRTSS